MREVDRKPDKRYWVKVYHKRGRRGGQMHLPVRPLPSMVNRARVLEKQGYDTRIWLDRHIAAWTLFKSRRKK